jgi:hypothetical protein
VGFLKKILSLLSILIFCILFSVSTGYSLNSGETYTVEIDAISSAGAIFDLSISTTAIADSNGKISFNISNVPDRSSYNFLLVTIKDSGGNTVRRAIAPTPVAGSTTNLGVSIVTDDQVDMLLGGMSSAGTDDPILVVMGLTMVRSASMTDTELSVIASVGVQGVRGTGGFVDYLTTTKGYSSSAMATFRNGIVNRLGQFSSLYKDAVDAATGSTSAEKRGEAAGLLMKILMESGTDASINTDDVLSAIHSMGEVVVPLFEAQVTAGNLRASVLAALNSSIGAAVQKANADRALEKYTQALSTLNASAEQINRYNTAATTLLNSMIEAFKTFEQLFLDPTSQPSEAQINAAQSALNTAMGAAFDVFITQSASTDAEIETMRNNLSNAFSVPLSTIPAEMFKFYDRQGNAVNWPIPMVASTSWVAGVVAAGGSLTYTRDNLAVPAMMMWLDSDDNPATGPDTDGDPGNGLFNNERHDFGSIDANSDPADQKNMPASMTSLFGLREDVEIIEFTKYSAFDTADNDGEVSMDEYKAIQAAFATRLEGRAGALGGTTNGSTPISATQKNALVTLQTSPDF